MNGGQIITKILEATVMEAVDMETAGMEIVDMEVEVTAAVVIQYMLTVGGFTCKIILPIMAHPV